jgi:tetratricopeptide (TPR) repeat protein
VRLAAQAARRDGRLDDAQQRLEGFHEARGDSPTPEADLQGELLQVQRGLVKEHVYALIAHLEHRHPQSEQILEALALGSAQVYRLDEASFWTKRLLEQFPGNPAGRLLDAQTRETLHYRERSLEIARQLVEDYPGNDRARLYLAGLLSRNRRYDEAVEHFRQLHRRDPADLVPLLGLVRVLLPLDLLDEAAPLVRRLEEDHPKSTDALLECGRFAMRQKRFADAEAFLSRALRQAPNDYEVHLEMAVCLEQLDRADEARGHLERFKQIEAEMKNLEKAVQAMVKSPMDPAPRLEAGRICLRNGQVEEGIRWLSGVLDLVPDHGPTHLTLADFYASQGDARRARFHRDRAAKPRSK